MLENYGYIALFLIVSLLIAVVMVLLPVLFRLLNLTPNKPNSVKNSPFECGMETIGKTWIRFNFHYYFYVLMYITLDVMVLFIYPWAIEIRVLGVTALISVLVFLLLIVIGFLYAWKKKVLEWK